MTRGEAPSILPADFRKLSKNPRFHPVDSESFSLNYEAARSLLYRLLLWEVMASCSLEGPVSIRQRTVNEIK